MDTVISDMHFLLLPGEPDALRDHRPDQWELVKDLYVEETQLGFSPAFIYGPVSPEIVLTVEAALLDLDRKGYINTENW